MTEPQQCVSLPLKALSHDVVVVLFGYVLIEIAVGTPPETVRPLGEEELYSHDTAHLQLNQVSQYAAADSICVTRTNLTHMHIKRRLLRDLWSRCPFRHIFGDFSAREAAQSRRQDTTGRVKCASHRSGDNVGLSGGRLQYLS